MKRKSRLIHAILSKVMQVRLNRLVAPRKAKRLQLETVKNQTKKMQTTKELPLLLSIRKKSQKRRKSKSRWKNR